MKINKTELIEILSIKTGLEKDEVEDQLKELIKRIKDAASRGKALEIKGFGIFYFDDSKNLRFDPADSFRTEVNFKYAGMEPVEVKPPRDTSVDTSDPEELMEEEEDVFGLGDIEDKPAAKEEAKPEFEVEPEPDLEPTPEPEAEAEPEDEPEEKPVEEAGIEMDAEADAEPEPDKKPDADLSEATEESTEEEKVPSPSFMFDSGEEDESAFDFLFGAKEKDIPDPVPEEELKKAGTVPAPAKEEKKKKVEAGGADKKKKDPVIMILSAVLVVVVLVAGFFIISDMMDTPPQEPVAADIPAEQPPAEAEQDVTDAREPEPADEVQAADEPAEPVAEETEVYGLTGSLVSDANDGYTIVLYSMRNRDNADAAADRLRNVGYRTILTERTMGGAPIYRVSVGQFESVSNAQQQANQLPEPYKNQNFIQRIQ